jgi:hypothetical protein
MTDAIELPEYLDEAMAKVEEFEDRVHWLYLDEDGLVTIAIGQMLPNVHDAQALPFHSPAGRTATPEEIALDFARVSAMERDHLPTFYLVASSLKLLDADIEKMLMVSVMDCVHDLEKILPHFDNWPKGAKLATIDMRFNLGPSRFRAYTHMILALDSEDFAAAAAQCDRDRKDAAFATRNYWTRTSFMNAELDAKVQDAVQALTPTKTA